MKYKIIDTISDLKDSVASLEKEKVIAVDLEADSMFHFKEKVCLIQVAAKNENLVIDPLKINDLSPIKPLFYNPGIKKIFHGADYDVRSLYRDFNIEINHIFDTQLACMFLGLNKTGLDVVLKSRFNVSLDKKYQKKDWSQRPLPEEMIEYAVMDITYLERLAEALEKELKIKKRLFWVHEECEYLSKVRHGPDQHMPLYVKVKGYRKLDLPSLAVFEALLKFRSQLAQKKDRPLFKILSTHCLKKISIQKPSSIYALNNMQVLSSKQINMYGNSIITVINTSLKGPEKFLPAYTCNNVPLLPAPDPKKIKVLKKWRDATAKRIQMEPGLLCSNALLAAIAIKNPNSLSALSQIKDIKKWRVNVFGEEIIAQLHRTH